MRKSFLSAVAVIVVIGWRPASGVAYFDIMDRSRTLITGTECFTSAARDRIRFTFEVFSYNSDGMLVEHLFALRGFSWHKA